MTNTKFTPFVPHPAHRQMTQADADVFALAAQMLAHPDVTKAILDAGGDTANIAHFSRSACRGRPINPWASDNDHETVKAALVSVSEALKVA